MRKIKDPIILGFMAGIIGNTAKTAGNLINRFVLHQTDTTYTEIAGGLFMNPKERRKPKGMIVGSVADFILGAIMGIPIVYMLRYTGKDKAGVKGLGLGYFAWVTMYGFLGRAMGQNKGVFPLKARTNLSALINHTWFGFVTGKAAAYLGDPSLFPEPKSVESEIQIVNTKGTERPHLVVHRNRLK